MSDDGTTVAIETFEIVDGGRQISSRRRISERLAERQADVAAAIEEAARLIQQAASAVPERKGWRVNALEAKFGVKLSAGAGVVLSSASTEASFEIVVKVTSD